MDRITGPTDVARAECILFAIEQHRCLHPSDREVIPGIERCRERNFRSQFDGPGRTRPPAMRYTIGVTGNNVKTSDAIPLLGL